jgi:hypothetical protein
MSANNDWFNPEVLAFMYRPIVEAETPYQALLKYAQLCSALILTAEQYCEMRLLEEAHGLRKDNETLVQYLASPVRFMSEMARKWGEELGQDIDSLDFSYDYRNQE